MLVCNSHGDQIRIGSGDTLIIFYGFSNLCWRMWWWDEYKHPYPSRGSNPGPLTYETYKKKTWLRSFASTRYLSQFCDGIMYPRLNGFVEISKRSKIISVCYLVIGTNVVRERYIKFTREEDMTSKIQNCCWFNRSISLLNKVYLRMEARIVPDLGDSVLLE